MAHWHKGCKHGLWRTFGPPHPAPACGVGHRGQGGALLSISKPMKRHSVLYYNDTARAAISASADRQRAGGGLAEYYSEGETRAPVWVCVGESGDTEKAATLVGLSAADRAGGPADLGMR